TDAAETEETGAADATAELETLTIGASSTPHAEILEAVRDTLAEAGYELNIIVYDDYIQPNLALDDGTLDANYFQHTPYLNSFNESNGTDLAVAALIHYEPFGIYANGVSDLSELAEGATIIIPADDSNETRALLLLQQEGLITLPDDASAEVGVTTLDIVDDGGYDIVAVQADTVPSQLLNSDEGTIAVINGNYALQAGLNVADALAIEDASGDAAQTYANIIAVRTGEEESEKTLALVNALQTDAVKTFIEESYNGAVVAIF
ncbi:MAG: MetQ/NlpA family ABC transporter substrate-binding protein, partial [Oscillospiraceae bacterium]|nr:MetQ/NlpA family ABC transporter substrate-binding protein [Oscillospiraceae bacterium]